MLKHLVYISFERENTKATHYHEIVDMTVVHYSESADMESVMAEITMWLKLNYPHSKTKRISINVQ